MRTTVDIDDDVLQAAKELAFQERTSLGKAISELVRRGIHRDIVFERRNGFPLLPAREGAGIVTLEHVNQLRDEGV